MHVILHVKEHVMSFTSPSCVHHNGGGGIYQVKRGFFHVTPSMYVEIVKAKM